MRRCKGRGGPWAAASVALVLATGCYTGRDGWAGGDGGTGDTAAESDTDADGGEPVDQAVLDRVGVSGLRRLTAVEYAATVHDLLGVEVDAALLLPEDWRQPFDNDYTTQVASQALIEGAELLAADVATLVVADEALREAAVGCTPESTADAACFREFVTRFGRRALRRPLTATEIERYAGLVVEAEHAGDFHAAVEVALRALLQHPEFLYRVELGTPVPDAPGVFRLGDHELAARLSYFLWGSTPSDALLDLADAGQLHTTEDIIAAAESMLDDPRARARVGRFHALWLGYEQLPHAPALASAMQAETQALIDRVVFEDGLPWQELLRAEETFVDATLAEHYGLPAPAGASAWVSYGESGRQGLLSHGAFLSAMAKVDDSSPTKRGILVRTRMMCQDIPPPPPNVNVDDTEPPEGTCKEEFYRTEHAQGNCAGCHGLMDPIGLGLEQYDHRGVFRTVENDDPTCVISGEGSLDGVPFSGPAELSDVLLDSGTLNRCVTRQLYRFAMGRSELQALDDAFVGSIVDEMGLQADFDLTELLVRFVSDEAFALRREEEEGQ
ncbi:DUF1592 domain-containing protein [Paraliomyxa miuraensis]|uniref:DUF1592 domain-containing protein n=1 Tax=Paraliomyxa miuraensis TaxID=376150 RepID=UPI0022564660|nr:DUF1592 domain-containing protein [Paraliomyxa miuraensis]MCX4243351.1 DUF1592 domain-containing protein [Paraliomyxa miuraensis]